MTDNKFSGNIPATSMDLSQHNLEQLKVLFPQVFTEGRVDFEALKSELGEHVETQGERYQFTWAGKEQAKRIATTPSLGTLRPVPEESVNWDVTENLYIEGDNLEVLKLLQKSYFNKVKMIYIDPPYNTGNDFVYKDDFKDNLANYQRLTGQRDEEGNPLTTNTDSAGRYHSNWLNMMYPRLKLARNLLCNDGVIFISIDDNEAHNLRKVCDEIFGEDNFVGKIIWQRSKKGDAKLIAKVHEYILCYARNKDSVVSSGPWRKSKGGAEQVLDKYSELRASLEGDHSAIRAEMQAWFKSLPKEDSRKSHKHYSWSDERGLYFPDNFAGPDDGRASRPRHDILHPVTGRSCKKPSTGWRWDEEKTNWALAENPPRIHFGPDETTIPTRKSYLFEIDSEPYSSVFYRDGRSATLEVEGLVGKGWFPFPKNIEVLSELIELATSPGDIVLDFFSGSGSSGHAVMRVNLAPGSQRKFVLIQLPEPTGRDGYQTIAEIGKERIRRAGEKIREEHPDAEADFGFKVLKLDSSNIKRWQPDYENLEQDLLGAVNNILDGRGSEDLLYEVLIKYGLPLTLPVKTLQVAGHTVYNVAGGSLVACFDEGVTLDVVQAIIGLATDDMPILRIVFRDTSFADDIVKTNAIQRFKQAGINDVLSI